MHNTQGSQSEGLQGFPRRLSILVMAGILSLIAMIGVTAPVSAGGPSPDYEWEKLYPWERHLTIIHVTPDIRESKTVLKDIVLEDTLQYLRGEIPFVVDRIISIDFDQVAIEDPLDGNGMGGPHEGQIYEEALRQLQWSACPTIPNIVGVYPEICDVVIISSLVGEDIPVCKPEPKCHWDLVAGALQVNLDRYVVMRVSTIALYGEDSKSTPNDVAHLGLLQSLTSREGQARVEVASSLKHAFARVVGETRFRLAN